MKILGYRELGFPGIWGRGEEKVEDLESTKKAPGRCVGQGLSMLS